MEIRVETKKAGIADSDNTVCKGFFHHLCLLYHSTIEH